VELRLGLGAVDDQLLQRRLSANYIEGCRFLEQDSKVRQVGQRFEEKAEIQIAPPGATWQSVLGDADSTDARKIALREVLRGDWPAHVEDGRHAAVAAVINAVLERVVGVSGRGGDHDAER